MKSIMKFIRKNWKKVIFGVFIALLIVYFFDNIGFYLFGEKNYRGELIKLVLTFGTGITSFLTWYNSYKKNAKIKEEQTNQQIQIMETNNEYVHFNNIIGHLGDNNLIVILEGINALQEIAVNNKNYTKRVHNLFCTYLRENSSKLYENIDFEKTPDKCPVIIQTLIDYLFKPYNDKENIYEEYQSDLSFSTLKNCVFNNTKIKNVSLNSCILERCYFNEKGSLSNCSFTSSTLTDCSFTSSTLTDCGFRGSILTTCDFSFGMLENCDFINNELDDGRYNAKLLDCVFENTEFINTKLPAESDIELLPNNGNAELPK